ncbi:MAG TPA: 1-aminocyclopropane-1-carboxylate deaminase [Niabella sp.]|nr:1-aminocyclopropane-1-carboxylate deaminase [Niabella sp.]HOZ95842.1 1-aminocyclopropane-1-carboxylate deaminase [Niabella sp.]HQW13696.1 1-aminocyclopropane-1-carboxylate deaminase [Niabella sp.]HQX19090.1 1-aminocyclopropane-1-carboxylate deaminase [Niabella sp.]HQX42747.1 1-aminocyclopropane-1-carboxylate deaminase [Niabella sp.]
MNIIQEERISIDPVSMLSTESVTVHTLRLDVIHPEISGNKWYKLRFYLDEAIQSKKKGILTFGGAYSNHIAATGAACKAAGIESIGIIRGEEPIQFGHTLTTAREQGMKLVFLSRTAFKNKLMPDDLSTEDYQIVPEGGYGILGANGASTIPYPKNDFDIICCATGTGTMLAGLIKNKSRLASVQGFSVLKNNFSIVEEVKTLLENQTEPIPMHHQFHFGGYAKHHPSLFQFMNDLYQQTKIPTDFVYTGKLFFGVNKLIQENYFEKGSRILIIHSGGLQGNLSLKKGTLIF